MNRWLLPEDIADVLPAEARKVETLRRAILDLYQSYGYELVAPPILEFLDSLLTGTGSDLNLQTFKLVDQLSGRTLGLRADMTPQVARIDAHLLNRSASGLSIVIMRRSKNCTFCNGDGSLIFNPGSTMTRLISPNANTTAYLR